MIQAIERLVDILDSSGGKIAILLFLIGVGIVMSIFKIVKAEDIIVGSFGALLGALKEAHSNFTRRGTGDGATVTSTVQESTVAK